MLPVFGSSERGLIDRFQHPSASPEKQYGAQRHRHMAVFGEARAPQQFQPGLEKLGRHGSRMHPDTSERSTRNLPRRRIAAQDSNDDDGETSSASEDSGFSGGYPSPSRSKARIPCAKRPEPSIGLGSEFSKRSRLLSDPQYKWSPDSDSCSATGNYRTSGNIVARQLPRMAALESYHHQQQRSLEYPKHQIQPKQPSLPSRDQPHPRQHHHQQAPPPPQFHPSQEPRHLPAVGSHGPTSGMMGTAPMQLPPLAMVRAPVPPVAPPLTSFVPAVRVMSPSTPGARPAAPVHAPSTSNHLHDQHNRQSHHCPQGSYLEAETAMPRQSTSINKTTARSSSSNNNGSECSGGALLRPWLSREEGDRLPQVSRIESFRGDRRPLSSARPGWAPVWSTPAQDHSEPYDHRPAYESGFSGDGVITSKSSGYVSRDSVAGDWSFDPGSYHPRTLQGREKSRHLVGPAQQHAKVLQRHDAIGSRTPSPAFRQQEALVHQQHQQQQDTNYFPPRVTLAPPLADRARKGGWKCAAASDKRAFGREDSNTEEDKQILERYIAHLNPKASREVWSHDEEEVLWRAQREYGNAWNYISGLLPGRSENAVKNHWYTQMRMFLGQRGSNPTNSKPCPPTTTAEGVRLASEKEGYQLGEQRKLEEDHRADAQREAAEVDKDHQAPPDVHALAENAARAEAVAALGMLFSAPSCGEGDDSASNPDRERVSSQRKGSCG